MSDLDRLNKHDLAHEPSPATKRLFLGVQHQPYFVGSTRLPGLFSFTDLDRSFKLFGFAVLLELAGFGAMRLFANASFVLLVLAGFFDIFLGYLAHLPVSRFVLFDNQAIAARTHDEQELAQKRSRTWRAWRTVLVVPIYAFACVKAWLLAVAYGRIDILSLALMACYLVTAMIHHRATGYAFSGRALLGALRRNYARYLEHRDETTLRFGGSRAIRHGLHGVVPVRSIRHELTPTHLVTYGVLLDRDVQTLVGPQPEALKEAVGKLCLRCQLWILEDEPIREGAVIDPDGSSVVEAQFPKPPHLSTAVPATSPAPVR